MEIMKEVYIVHRLWTDFEDDECNASQIDGVYTNYADARSKLLSLIVEELEVEMVLVETCVFEDLIQIINTRSYIVLNQNVGDGKTYIYIDRMEMNK